MKKLLSLLLVATMVLSLVACGEANSESESTNKKPPIKETIDNLLEEENNDTENGEIENDESALQRYTFVGYQVAYPKGLNPTHTDYGYIFQQGGNVVFVDAPGTAGILMDLSSVEEIPEAVEEYVYDTLEGMRSLFDTSNTEQVIMTSEVKIINKIEMLRVTGVFKNTDENTEVAYVAYYFLCGEEHNQPIYMIGIEFDETATIEDFVDSLAQEITKK